MAKHALFVLAALSLVTASPFETHIVWDNFYESVEMLAGYDVGNDFKEISNGDVISYETLKQSPRIATICGVNSTALYTLVMISYDDVGNQRLLFVTGNIPGNRNKSGAVIKMPYTAPLAKGDQTQLLILFEMKEFIPRWKVGTCTTLNGTKLVTECNDPDPTKCTQKYVEDDECLAWKELPSPDQRTQFVLKQFAEANNLTAIDILWFKSTTPPPTTPSNVLIATSEMPPQTLTQNTKEAEKEPFQLKQEIEKCGKRSHQSKSKTDSQTP
eukprot:c7274_g1_i1.p1 GENE.c7274_g1_i1~~c7274_g1_i1.p1  ORF type:complete len:286 (+),score=74.29 c7274_g1_i1:46-858(+)